MTVSSLHMLAPCWTKLIAKMLQSLGVVGAVAVEEERVVCADGRTRLAPFAVNQRRGGRRALTSRTENISMSRRQLCDCWIFGEVSDGRGLEKHRREGCVCWTRCALYSYWQQHSNWLGSPNTLSFTKERNARGVVALT